MNATNSGVTPEAGITYSNLFVFFSRDEEKGPHGEILATGQNSIMIDMNSFDRVSKKEMGLLGGAVFLASATLPIANNSLTSDLSGASGRRWRVCGFLLSTVYSRRVAVRVKIADRVEVTVDLKAKRVSGPPLVFKE